MESIFSHFLEVACSVCRAARVGLRVVWNGDGNPFVLAERWFDAAGGEHRVPARPHALQMSLFPAGAALMEARAVVPQAMGLAASRDGSAVVPWDRSIVEPGEHAAPGSRGADSWNISMVDHEYRCTGRFGAFMIEFRALLPRDMDDHGLDTAQDVRRLISLLEWLVESCCPASGSPRLVEHPFSPPLVGESPAIREIKQQTRLVASSDIPVLIEGESGTGKEVIARNIHALGPRSARPLVILNCLEMPPALVQSELFGHVKGSFTGASRDRIGLVESADGGTLFLDEVGEMPRALQATLLRVLQEKEVRRVGESARRRVDVRFVFATNRRLRELVERKRFRLDLFHRMSSVRVHIPPLRERRADIPTLARHFLELSAARCGNARRSITSEAMRRFLAHAWPGNVRELRNEIERAIALNPEARRIEASMLSPHLGSDGMDLTEEEPPTLPEAVRRLECRMIQEALETFSGNRTRTARQLGITRQGLLKKLKRYRIAPPARDID
jgi:DNA-binding NtrC family response regulator